MKMQPGEKAILPVWFRAGFVLALTTTLVCAYTFKLDASAEHQADNTTEHGRIVEQAQLHFVDLESGSVLVVDAQSGDEITRLHTGEDGFMRSVMRGMVRERKAKGIGPEVPFQLAVWEDDLVSLIDPTTQRRVELSAFGPDNVAAFTRLLPQQRGHQLSIPAS